MWASNFETPVHFWESAPDNMKHDRSLLVDVSVENSV